MPQREAERGSAIIEFALAGIPLVFLLLVILEFCLAMWSYHTLASAVDAGAEFASTKGSDCAPSCAVSIGQVTQVILNAGVGLNPNQLKLTFSPGSVSCTAVNCLSNSTVWPPSGNNAVGTLISIQATYPAPLSIAPFWPGKLFPAIGSVNFSATSTQMIQF
jgi:hypothetical protein